MKNNPVDIKLSKYIDLTKENNIEDPRLGGGDHVHVRILKYKYIFAEGYVPIDLEKFLYIKMLCVSDVYY